MSTIHLWLREDGEQPKAIQAGSTPKGPGLVVAVSNVRTSDEARKAAAHWERVRILTPAQMEALLVRSPMEFAEAHRVLRMVEVVRG